MTSLTLTIFFLLSASGTPQEQEVKEEVHRLLSDLAKAEEINAYDIVKRLGEIGPPACEAIPALEALDSGNLGSWALAARCKIGPGPLPFPHRITEHAITDEGSASDDLHQFVLHVLQTGQEFNLGKLRSSGDFGTGQGFDKDSLLLQWLEPGKVLLAHWETLRQGSGAYQGQGNVILVKSSGLWYEALRHCDVYYSRGGSADISRTIYKFDWSEKRRELFVKKTEYTSEYAEASAPLVHCWQGDNGEFCSRAYSFVLEWKARMEAGSSFTFGMGRKYFSPDDEHPVSMREVADFLQRAPEELLQKTPGLSPDSLCPDRILIETELPPLQPSPYDIYHTGL